MTSDPLKKKGEGDAMDEEKDGKDADLDEEKFEDEEDEAELMDTDWTAEEKEY